MKPSTWVLVAGSLVVLVGMVVAFGRTQAKRAVLYSQLRQHGLSHSVSRLLAAYWPERMLSWTLKATRGYDRRVGQAKKQAAKVLHLPPRPHFPVRRVA